MAPITPSWEDVATRYAEQVTDLEAQLQTAKGRIQDLEDRLDRSLMRDALLKSEQQTKTLQGALREVRQHWIPIVNDVIDNALKSGGKEDGP